MGRKEVADRNVGKDGVVDDGDIETSLNGSKRIISYSLLYGHV